MPKNVEIKARVKDFDKVINIAESLCGTNANILFQEDTFFNTSTGRLKLRSFQDGSKSQLIFYNRADIEGPKISDYSICSIENPTALTDVLKSALGITGTVKKTRYFFLYNDTRIHIDRVEGLGDFLELEVVLGVNQSCKEGEEVAFNLMSKLGIHNADLISGAYINLLQKK